MIGIFSNPEFIRYSRSQLRPARLLSTAIICLALSLAIGFSILHADIYIHDQYQLAGVKLLGIAFVLQALVLAAGGGIACLNSIYSEKEQNTFDYQRITRLTATELAVGKLFGAPLWMYFICLCLAPLTIYAAIVAQARLSLVLAAYVVLLVASVAFHTFTLFLSLLAVRGSQVSGILLALLVLWLGSVDFSRNDFGIHSIGPFEAENFATAHSWKMISAFKLLNGREFSGNEFADVFFTETIHHFPVLVGIDLFLGFWFFLGVIRNIKKDPQYYEVYSPLQFLGFALFLNFLFVGFQNLKWSTPIDTQALLLTYNMVIFFLLGIALLRNRERMRSLLSNHERYATNWWNAVWPAPILSLGTVLAGVMIVVALTHTHSSFGDWSLGFSIFRCLFFTVWIVSNIQFLQYMNLRPGKHPLVMATLYLSIYYVCVSLFLSVIGSFRIPENTPISSLFVPSAVFLLEPKTWEDGPGLWIAGFVIQVVLILLFVSLQRRRVRQLTGSLLSAGIEG